MFARLTSKDKEFQNLDPNIPKERPPKVGRREEGTCKIREFAKRSLNREKDGRTPVGFSRRGKREQTL